MQIEAKLPKYFDLYTLHLFSFCNTIYFSVTRYYFLIFSSYSASDHLEHRILNVTLANMILLRLKTLSLSVLFICVFFLSVSFFCVFGCLVGYLDWVSN